MLRKYDMAILRGAVLIVICTIVVTCMYYSGERETVALTTSSIPKWQPPQIAYNTNLTELVTDYIDATYPTKEVNIVESETVEVFSTEAAVEVVSTWSDEDLYYLTQAICGEAGSSYCTDEHQQAVANVIINRREHSKYPNSIKGVITQKGQYAFPIHRSYEKTLGEKDYERAKKNALAVLEGSRVISDNVIYQAEFKQGHGVEKIFKTKASTTYFCYE